LGENTSTQAIFTANNDIGRDVIYSGLLVEGGDKLAFSQENSPVNNNSISASGDCIG